MFGSQVSYKHGHTFGCHAVRVFELKISGLEREVETSINIGCKHSKFDYCGYMYCTFLLCFVVNVYFVMTSLISNRCGLDVYIHVEQTITFWKCFLEEF